MLMLRVKAKTSAVCDLPSGRFLVVGKGAEVTLSEDDLEGCWALFEVLDYTETNPVAEAVVKPKRTTAKRK